VWKKYYVILLPRTIIIFFWDGHGLVLKCSTLINVPFILRHEGHEMKLKFMTPRQGSMDQHRLKEKIEKRKNRKRRNINYRRKGNWRKRNGSKDKDDGKGSRETTCLIEGHPRSVAFVYESDNNVVSQRLVEKLQLPTSFHSDQPRIKFKTGQCVKEVLCDITPTNSCHLLLRWAWLHFKTLNLDKRSIYFEAWGTWNEVEIYDTKTSQ